ncbi:nucleotidyltransferase family protein [Fictibacillus sp. B-59209]|uniref:nucleotidyltransferase family protein n=1 Tax=Fictibacillus sp. B-59209 TaxID=3024873 RepID=UPI002E1B5779|nr:nucleotidyltransferase family protein [Fictibacillus sp. B-59209]
MKAGSSGEVYGIVPASGFSRRMGSQKLVLPWRNKAILSHVLETAAQSHLKGIYTVIPEGEEERKHIVLKVGCNPIINTLPSNGIGHSLSLAISKLPHTADAVMILLGDQPELRREDIQRVLLRFAHFQSGTDKGSRVVIQTRYGDGQVGHPILFSKSFFSDLAQLEGDRGGNRIIRSNSDCSLLVESPHRYPPDIDTMADYEKLLIRE